MLISEQKVILILRKIHKTCDQSCSFWLKYAPEIVLLGLHSRSLGGAYSTPPDSLAIFIERRGQDEIRKKGREVRPHNITVVLTPPEPPHICFQANGVISHCNLVRLVKDYVAKGQEVNKLSNAF